MTINKIQEEVINDLEDLETIEKYEYLINLGKLLPQISEKDKIDKNKIVGCQSRAWIFETDKLPKPNIQNLNPKTCTKSQDNLELENKESLNQEKNQILLQNIPSNLSQTLEQKLFFGGFSDSQIVCGLLGLLWKIFDGQTKNEILHSDLFLLTRIGFDELLTVRRREGFWQIYDKIIEMCKS